MVTLIENNTIKASKLIIPAAGIIPEIVVVCNVRISNVLDREGKKTDIVEAVRYDCVNPDDFSRFTIKVEAKDPILTKAILDTAEEPVYISIPIEETFLRPYEISYGKAKVSIIAPYVTIVES